MLVELTLTDGRSYFVNPRQVTGVLEHQKDKAACFVDVFSGGDAGEIKHGVVATIVRGTAAEVAAKLNAAEGK